MFNIDRSMPKTESGAWAEFEGSKFLVAHITNLKFQRALARLQQPYRRKIEAGTMDPKVSKDLMCQAMAEALVLNWKDVVDDSGTVVDYSSEGCYKALLNNPQFREFVATFAAELDNFREEEVEEAGKSSAIG